MQLDNIIKGYYGFLSTAGDVGIEIEMEGSKSFPFNIDKWWNAEEDGSLRGYSVEYVMRRPCKINKVDEYLAYLKEQLDDYGAKPRYSERAGVHVHLNVQSLTFKQALYVACTYFALEKALVRYCGSNREGNHFCLRLEDANYLLTPLEEMITWDNPARLHDDDIRYASLNFVSLGKYGSLEFRAMETQPDFSKISEWAHMLVAIREYAKDKGRARDIAAEISGYGPTGWARMVLGDTLFNHINYADFDMDVMRCMRNIQPILYHRNL